MSPQRLTPAAAEVVAVAGIQESFVKVAERTLHKLTGLRLSESTVERVTEGAGTRLAAALEAGMVLGVATPWDWHRDASGQSCAYVSVDATGILMQGPKASKVDGRMVYVGMIYNPQPRDAAEEALSKPCDGARYLAGLYTLEELGLQLRRQGAQVGMNQAQQWIALTDGGNGVEEFMDVNFAQAAKILDFQHAAGHVALRKNVHRRDYAAYLRQGWQIASGGVESACKTVVNQRLCQGEMRLGEEGSDAVAHQRALYRSDADQWEAFWAMAP